MGIVIVICAVVIFVALATANLLTNHESCKPEEDHRNGSGN